MKNTVLRSRHRLWKRRVDRAAFLVSVLFILSAALGSARAGGSCNQLPQVHAVLADGHRKIPWGLDPVGAALTAEFRRVDVQLLLLTGGDPRPEGIVVFVNILPHQPTDWGLSRKALGAVRREDGHSSPVFIFYPSIARVLGAPRDTARVSDPEIPSAKWILGLARIILHEILHVLLPEKSHDRQGVFASDLRLDTLIAADLQLAPETRAALLGTLCASGFVFGRF